MPSSNDLPSSRSSTRRWAALAIAAAVVAVVVVSADTTTNAAATSAEELAARYAPVMMVQTQAEACGDGEPYRPTSVDAVLGQPGVVLRDANGAVLAEPPTAADLFDAPADAHLDIPGGALNPGCDYERWLRSTGEADRPTVYARVLTDPEAPGRLVVQYWMFWIYNDWNNRHEGDWEMMQLVFDAPTADAALLLDAPTEVMISQHEGGERRSWDRVSQSAGHPVVFPAGGSHANFFSSHRWFGKDGQSGFGCDDTRGPSTTLSPAVVLLPDEVSGRDDPFAWTVWAGHWGEEQRSINNGPTGPVTKDQWTHPVVWMETEGRTASVSLPEQGSKVTDFFCSASTKGSLLFIEFLDRPWLVAATLVAVIALLVLGVRRTLWSPDLPLPLVQRRRLGQMLPRIRSPAVGAPTAVRDDLGADPDRRAPRRALPTAGAHDPRSSTPSRTPSARTTRRPSHWHCSPVRWSPSRSPIYAAAAATHLAGAIDRGGEPRPVLRDAGLSRALLATIPVALLVVFGWLLIPVAVLLLVWWCAAPRGRRCGRPRHPRRARTLASADPRTPVASARDGGDHVRRRGTHRSPRGHARAVDLQRILRGGERHRGGVQRGDDPMGRCGARVAAR